jgi:RNA-directed DNA polymerase
MKRVGNLWEQVMDRANLLGAFHRAARGKRWKGEVRAFAENLDVNLDRMRKECMDLSFSTGIFHVFQVYDPKERTIHAARFPERVFHHALMNYCEPVLEKKSDFSQLRLSQRKGTIEGDHGCGKCGPRQCLVLEARYPKIF